MTEREEELRLKRIECRLKLDKHLERIVNKFKVSPHMVRGFDTKFVLELIHDYDELKDTEKELKGGA